MKIRVFQADKGDCLLIESNDGELMLVDGGMRSAYKKHVASFLGKLAQAKKAIALVYISHNDSDHISGVLQMLDDHAAWRIYEYKKANGQVSKPPKRPCPPQIKRIWHN